MSSSAGTHRAPRTAAPHARSGLRVGVVWAASACLVVGLGTPSAIAAASGRSALHVRGTVERVHLDDFSAPSTGDRDEITFVRTGDGMVQVPRSALASAPNGASVDVTLADGSGVRTTTGGALTSDLSASQSSDPDAGADVAAVEVSPPVAGTSATGEGLAVTDQAVAAGSAPHQALVVVAVPAGGVAPSVTASEVAATIDSGVSDYWSNVTHGAVTFTATAYPSVVTTTTTPCTSGGVSTSSAFWNEVTSKTHWTSGSGKHLVVYFAALPACGGMAGLGTVGSGLGSGGVIWSNGYNTVGVLGHELGHNLGLGHSQELDCTSNGVRVIDAAPAACSIRGYWDTNDIMALSWNNQGYLNASHLRRLGLLDASSQATPVDDNAVTLAPLETGAGMRVLTLSDGGTKYVVEYRQPIGQDAWMSTYPGWGAVGVTVRKEVDLTQPGTSSYLAYESYLLDGDPSTPDTSLGSSHTALPVGSWIDLAGGRLGLRIVSESPSGAVVEYRNGLASTDARYVAPPKPSVSTPVGSLGVGRVRALSTGPDVPVLWSWQVSSSSRRAIVAARAGLSRWVASSYRATATAVDGTVVAAAGRVNARYLSEAVARVATYSRGAHGWAVVRAPAAVGASLRASAKKGSAVALKLGGRSIGVLLATGRQYGAVAVYLDGHRVAVLSMRSTSSTVRVAWQHSFPVSGSHRVRLVNLTGGARGLVGFDGVVALL